MAVNISMTGSPRLLAVAALTVLLVAGSQLLLESRAEAQRLSSPLGGLAWVLETVYAKDLADSQRPTNCSPLRDLSPNVRLDRFGKPRDPFGSAARPFYFYWDELRIVAPVFSANVSGEGPPINSTPGTLRARIVAGPPNLNVQRDFVRVPSTNETAVQFTRDELMRNGSPGLARIEVEFLPDGAATASPATTLHIIPAQPWTVVLTESGPADPRFTNSFSSQFLPCEPVFRYVPTKPELGVVPLILTHAIPFVTDTGRTTTSLRARINASSAQAIHDVSLGWADLWTDKKGVADLIVERQGSAVTLLSLTSTVVAGFQEAPTAFLGSRKIFAVALDRTGVASGPYLNRRRPPLLSFVQEAFLRFDNTLSDRQFIVTFNNIPESSRAELVAGGLKVTDCRDTKCKASVSVIANTPTLVPLNGLREALAKGDIGSVVTFQVSFFDDEITPSNSAGYFTFVDESNFREAGSATAWTSAISVTAVRDPDLTTFIRDPVKTPIIDFEHPMTTEHANRFHFTGGATIGIKQQLGARADGEVELVAKKGDLGFDSGGVTASKYVATVYALKTATLTGGRFDLAAPTNSISLSESGEAINGGIRFGPVQSYVGHIVRKEIPDGSFTVAESIKARAAKGVLDKQHNAWLLQLRDATFGTDRLRTSWYGLRGQAKRGFTPEGAAATDTTVEMTPYHLTYWTTGADVFLTGRTAHLTGGLYYNTRGSDDAPPSELEIVERSGFAGLVTANYSQVTDELVQGKQRIAWAVSGTVAGGGNFVGETQAFAPDVLFLSVFAPVLREPAYAIGPGLTNKWYFGGAVNVPQWNLLGRIDSMRPSARDIAAASMSFKVHHYRQRVTDAASRVLATEGNVEIRVESPKGVRFQLVLAGMWPGDALRHPVPGATLVDKWQYAFKLGMTVRLE